MKVKIVFFAHIREQLNCDSLELEQQTGTMTSQLLGNLKKKNEHWRDVLSGHFVIAVNHQMMEQDIELKEGDEVAVFPPVTGG